MSGVAGIRIRMKHDGLNDYSMNQVIEPVSELFTESLVRADFSYLKQEELHYTLLIDKKIIEFRSNDVDGIKKFLYKESY